MDWSKIEPFENLCRRKVWNGGEEEWEVPMDTFLPIFQTALEEVPEPYRETAVNFFEYVKNDSKVFAFDTIYVMAGRRGFMSEDKERKYILAVA